MTILSNSARMRVAVTFFCSAIFSIAAVMSAPAQAGEIRIDNAFAYLVDDEMNGKRIEVYMDIANTGDSMDRLYAVRSKLATMTNLSVVSKGGAMDHGKDGMADSKHLSTSALMISPGQVAKLERGASHIMLMKPEGWPEAGKTFQLTLFFQQAGRVTVEVIMQPWELAYSPAR
jgi:hypothetical protein